MLLNCVEVWWKENILTKERISAPKASNTGFFFSLQNKYAIALDFLN